MPRLGNERHELYCQHRAKGMVPSKAARAAGFATGSSIYSELENNPDVVGRITELMRSFEEKKDQNRIAAEEAARVVGQMTGFSRAWVIEQLAATAIEARQSREFAESTHALELIGKEFGMFKGNNEQGDGSMVSPHLDMDSTEALLRKAEEPLQIEAEPKDEPPDIELIEKLIKGNRSMRAKDRKLSTGSETDVAPILDGETVLETDSE